jgi:hypothetical protein
MFSIITYVRYILTASNKLAEAKTIETADQAALRLITLCTKAAYYHSSIQVVG